MLEKIKSQAVKDFISSLKKGLPKDWDTKIEQKDEIIQICILSEQDPIERKQLATLTIHTNNTNFTHKIEFFLYSNSKQKKIINSAISIALAEKLPLEKIK